MARPATPTTTTTTGTATARQTQDDDWLPAALVSGFLGLVCGVWILSCTPRPATPPVTPPTITDLGEMPPCPAAPDPVEQPGSCGRQEAGRSFCTLCLNAEKCIGPHHTYCVERRLGCDDPRCRR